MTNIKEAIDFYIEGNNLKYKIEGNQSIADHAYGSCILAIALNSEFKLTNDIAKVIRMICLFEINDNLGLPAIIALNKCEKFNKDLIEFCVPSNNSPEVILARYAKYLDNNLHNLLSENKNDEFDILFKKCENFFIENDVEKCKEIFKFYYLNEKLKNKIRSGWDKNHWNIKTDRAERVSEHVFGTIILALALDSELEYDINIDQVIEILCVHELGEILIGDITPFDGITPIEKEEIEHKAVREVVGNLEEGEKIANYVNLFDKKSCKETVFAYFCDKLEADIQSKIYQDKNMHNTLEEQENNIALRNPDIKKIIDNGATNAFDVWYQWDYDKYINEDNFLSVLKYVKKNKLIKKET